ncbi:MAG: MFS transporter [Methylobacteriaceae bacterium]|nr:MFS transporter [Methylobacteriaceae bacterium]
MPLRAKIEGFSDVSIGLLGSVYFGGMLAGTLAAPAIVRWSGHIRAFTAFVAVAVVVVLLYPIAVKPAAWIGLRGVIGFAFAGLYAVIESWVNAKAENENRGRVYAVYQVVHFAGSASGQQFLGLEGAQSFALFSATAALFALALLPLSITQADPPGEPGSARVRIGWMSRMAPVAAAAAFLVGAANGSYWSLAPVYALQVGLAPGQVGVMMTATILGSALAVYPVGRLSDRFDRRLVLVWCATAGAVVEAILVVARAPDFTMLLALMFAIGATTMVLYSLAASHANDRVGPEHGVEIASALLFLYCAGAILFPTVSAWLVGRFGPPALFAQNACLHAALVVFTVWRMSIRTRAPRVPTDERAVVKKPTP